MDKIKDTMPLKAFSMIKKSAPYSQVEVVEANDGKYARWSERLKIPDSLKSVNWKSCYEPVRDQGEHDICWAFVSTELVSCIRYIEGYDEEYRRYSVQDLVDFAVDKKSKKKNHFCHTYNIVGGLNYIKENGVQKDEEREFVGCRETPPPRNSLDYTFIKGVKKMDTYDEVFEMLRIGPVGVGLAIFQPDYTLVGDKIYRGPMFDASEFKGFHAVQIVCVDEENGEAYCLVRSSHGTRIGMDGYLKVSMEMTLLYVSKDNVRKEREFGTPSHLLKHFCRPEMFSKEEERSKPENKESPKM